MKQTWLVNWLVVTALLVSASVTFAAESTLRIRDWMTEGTMTGKLCIKKYGCERARQPFSGNVFLMKTIV